MCLLSLHINIEYNIIRFLAAPAKFSEPTPKSEALSREILQYCCIVPHNIQASCNSVALNKNSQFDPNLSFGTQFVCGQPKHDIIIIIIIIIVRDIAENRDFFGGVVCLNDNRICLLF